MRGATGFISSLYFGFYLSLSSIYGLSLADVNSTNVTEPSSSCIKVQPEDVRAVNVTATSVELQWKPNMLTSVTGYYVRYNGECGKGERTVQGKNSSSKRIEGLQPHTNYTVCMKILCNDSTPDIHCSYTNFTTHSEVTMAPQRVVADIQNATHVLLSWQAFNACTWNGEPRMYKVYIRDVSLPEREETNYSVDWREHMVTILPERGVVYNISVSGVNDKGEGMRSTPIPLTIPEPPCGDFFFCQTYSYYIVAGGAAFVIAVLATVCVLVCKKICFKRKVTYCRDITERQISLQNFKHPKEYTGPVDLNDFESMTDVNSEAPDLDHEDLTHPHHRREPLYNNGWVYQAGHGNGIHSQLDNQYATLDSVGKSSCSSLSSFSHEGHTSVSPAHKRDQTIPEKTAAYPYEIPSRKGSGDLNHIYQSVDDASDEMVRVPTYPYGVPASRLTNTLPSSIPSSTSTSRESSVEPRFATLGSRSGGNGGYSLPPLPEHSPPPLRRSTLDLMERLREESDYYGKSGHVDRPIRAASSPVVSHFRVGRMSGHMGSVPNIMDQHSPLCLSDDSLANHGPTQTPPPEYYDDSSSRWMKTAHL